MNVMKNQRVRPPFIAASAVSALYWVALKLAEPSRFIDFSLVWLFFAGIFLIPAFPDTRVARFCRNFFVGTKPRKIATAALGSLLVAISAGIFAYILVPPAPSTARDSLPEARYVIILGGGLTPAGNVPKGVALRLDAGAAYIAAHPGTKAVVTGGKPRGSARTEASAMAEYLEQKKGIPGENILRDERARNTIENFAFSKELIARDSGGESLPPVLVITNDFHLKRALILARNAGYPKASGLAATTPPLYLPTDWLREIAAYWKLGLRSAFL
jgi:uncharacterized SAM-binding protein YcdF (DUF218 family)